MKPELTLLWAQYLRQEDDDEKLGDLLLLDSRSDIRWALPHATYHLHLGMYRNRQKQVTVIADGAEYRGYNLNQQDILGDRIASGTLYEMLELLRVYAQML